MSRRATILLATIWLCSPPLLFSQASNATAAAAEGVPAKKTDEGLPAGAKVEETKTSGTAGKTAAAPAAKPKQDPPPPEPGQLFVELRYVIDGTLIQGNRDRSFLHSGINHSTELSFFRSMTLGNGPRFEALVIGRYTDNPRVDPERNSLQKGYVKLTGQSYEAMLGDGLANYSRLTMNQNIKGLHLRKDFHPRLRAQGVVGYFTDRWGSLYRDYTVFRDVTLDCLAGVSLGFVTPGCVEDPVGSGLFTISPDNPGKPYSRLTGGARVEWKFGQGSWLAGNWSHGKDLHQSLPEARVFCDDALGFRTVRFIRPGCLAGETLLPGSNRPAIEAANNDVASAEVNYEWRPLGLNARGEIARSWTSGGQPPAGATFSNFVCATQSPVVGGSVLDSRCFAGQVSDSAVRAEVTQRWKKLRWRSDYARFSPDFFSASARQVRDLQDYYGRVDYDLTEKVALTWSWRRSTDNLNGQRNFTNVVRSPEIRAGIRDLPFYRPLLLQIGYRQRTLETAGQPLAAERRARTTYIPFLSADIPVGSAMRFGVDYEHRNDVDGVRHALSSETDRYGFSFRGTWNWNGWDFAPDLRWDLERLRKSVPFDPAFSPLDPLLLFPDDFLDAFDSNRSMRAGFLLEAPKYFVIEAYYREFNSVVLLPVLASAALDPLQRFFYLNPGFKRPNWRATLTYKIRNNDNRLLTFLYERSNNRFPAGDPFVPDLRSFRETVIGGTVLLRFGH